LQSGEAELVVGSRYVSGGDTGSFGSTRLGGSVFATNIARKLLHIEIADPMSGFFMLRRDRFEQLAPSLSVQGFKILLDIVATAGGKLRIVEVPLSFGARQHGESKLDSMVVLDFLGLVLAKMTGDLVSLRFRCSRWSAALVSACTSSRSIPRSRSSALRRGAGHRRVRRDDRKLSAQQPAHLS
jgi:dolichol-phosphate mannosyltransferase